METDGDNPPCQLYLITPPEIDLAAFSDSLKAALDAGAVGCLQLRLKGASDADILKAAETLIPICHAHDVAFVMNDSAALAKEAGADAVHIGQSDGQIADARELLGFDTAIGVTCHGSRHLAMVAGEQGADYVAFGAFFPSKTKEPPTMADVELLSWWSNLAELPCVAIGGITPKNCAPLVEAGADFLAVSHAVWSGPAGPGAAVEEFNAKIEEVLGGK